MSIVLPRPIVYGAHPGTIAGFTITGQIGLTVATGGGGSTAVGEADMLAGDAEGGGNTVACGTGGGVHDIETAIGDALTVTGFAHAGHNTVIADADGEAFALGDAVTLSGDAQAGHNVVTADSVRGAEACGDAETMTGHAMGGYNTVSGSSGLGEPSLYGDAETLSQFAVGGHNTLTAVDTSVMYGDAYALTGFASGGGNTLIGPSNPPPIEGPPTPTVMYGDGYELLGFSSGGGNTLVSGQNSNDVMWGDAAIVSPTAHTRANTFVFAPQNGHDAIMDFRSGEDHIALEGFGFTGFQQLSQHFEQTAKGLDIVFDANDDILLSGVTKVQASDFLFT